MFVISASTLVHDERVSVREERDRKESEREKTETEKLTTSSSADNKGGHVGDVRSVAYTSMFQVEGFGRLLHGQALTCQKCVRENNYVED